MAEGFGLPVPLLGRLMSQAHWGLLRLTKRDINAACRSSVIAYRLPDRTQILI
jgi:hypothetical protein